MQLMLCKNHTDSDIVGQPSYDIGATYRKIKVT